MKIIDVSVLPDNFLVELMHPENEAIDIIKKFKHEAGDYLDGGWLMRPCLGIDHFNDGSLFLPDGLIVEFKTFEVHDGTIKGLIKNNSIVQYELDTSHQVTVMAITKSNHNEADPFDLMCLQDLEKRANGIEVNNE